MTLFQDTFPEMSRDVQYPEAYAKELFTHNNSSAEDVIRAISEDSGETICSRSLIMLIQHMSERIYELDYEIRQLKGE